MFKVFCLIVFNLLAFTADILKNKRCNSPYLEEGVCVNYVECDYAFDKLYEDTLLSIEPCGCGRDEVCCGPFSKNISSDRFTCNYTTQQIDTFAPVSIASVCGLDKFSTNRILGGTVVNFGEFPWLVAIESNSIISNDSTGIRCGGSIVTKRYILTAAHCIAHPEFVATRVWLGVTNIGREGNCLNMAGKAHCINSVQKIIIEEVYPHPSYNSISSSNDIGLVLLKGSIEYSEYVRPICLPSSDSAAPKPGTVMTVAGWGATDQQGTRSNIKLKVNLPLQNNEVCNIFLKREFREITAKQLCVGGESLKDTCQGDSGGPLMKDFINENGDVQWYQEGIVSYGHGCGRTGRPAVYTKVSSYVRWISHIIDKFYYQLALGDACTTPNGRVGTCVSLDTCKEVFKNVATKNEDGYLFAIESRCGDDIEILVCCESPGSIILPDFNSTNLPNKTTCGVVKDKASILGDRDADLGEFPWVAAIECISPFNETEKIISNAGSVITSRYVLTAAYVVVHFKPIAVWVGDWKLSTDPDCIQLLANIECADPVQKIPIKKTIPHLFYRGPSQQYDIALILLEKEIKFSRYAAPICLPPPSLPAPTPGITMSIVGWGSAKYYSTSYNILRYVEVPIVANEECSKEVRVIGDQILYLQQFCTGGEVYRDSCEGDIGGPLMRIYDDKTNGGLLQWYQVGIHTETSTCSLGNFPVIFTRVSSYTNWIVNIISED